MNSAIASRICSSVGDEDENRQHRAGHARIGPMVFRSSELRTLGRTGLQVSPLGLGLAALGRPGYINVGHGEDLRGETDVDAMERNAHHVLDTAFEGGVRYFDAARSYGRAEAFLAHWLERRGLRPGELTVGSKWGYTYTAGWRVDADPAEVKDLSAPTLRRQLAESRALLGPHLRLYQIHSATLESEVLEDTAVLEELRRLRGEGVGGNDPARARRRRLRHGSGNVEPPRALCGPCTRGSARSGPRPDRQRGLGQRSPYRTWRRFGARAGRR
jgi:Aldo/keto reductase family